MAKVLVPLDGSKLSERALTEGLTHLQRGCELTLLTCLDPSQHLDLIPESASTRALEAQEREIGEKSKAYLKEQASHLRQSGYSVQFLLKRGEAVSQILKASERRRGRPDRDEQPRAQRPKAVVFGKRG